MGGNGAVHRYVRRALGVGVAVTILLFSSLVAGCASTAVGSLPTLQVAPVMGQQQLRLEAAGTVPAGRPMCLNGEPGCIETGWGPGWDLASVTERGQLRLRHSHLGECTPRNIFNAPNAALAWPDPAHRRPCP